MYQNFLKRNKNFDGLMNFYSDLMNLDSKLFDVINESGSDENYKWDKKTYTSPNGLFKMISMVKTPNDENPKEENEISLLVNELNKSVESQDFEKAIELRDKIKSLKQKSETIQKLEEELKVAIEKQDFETCIKLRDKIKKTK